MKAPPAPANPPKKIWETWDKPIDGITAQDIKRALEFWGKDSKDSYYRENGKLTDAYVSNPKNAHRLVDTTPPDYQPKKPVPVPDPACTKCRGTGELKPVFVKVPGQRAEQTIISHCPCRHIPGAGK